MTEMELEILEVQIFVSINSLFKEYGERTQLACPITSKIP